MVMKRKNYINLSINNFRSSIIEQGEMKNEDRCTVDSCVCNYFINILHLHSHKISSVMCIRCMTKRKDSYDKKIVS